MRRPSDPAAPERPLLGEPLLVARRPGPPSAPGARRARGRLSGSGQAPRCRRGLAGESGSPTPGGRVSSWPRGLAPAAAAAASALSPGLRSAAASVEVLTSTTHDAADQSRRAVCLSGHGCAFHSVDDRLFAQERFRFLRRLSGAPGREPSVTAHLILRPGDPLPLGALLYLVALVDALLLRRLSFLGTWNAEGTQGSRPGTSESSSPCL